ncbi:hypothetical protein N7495_000748 [Penicillium taxi]|uniref:uncharacterized protein n=1 Tax=Penicillium taxi TaxID=168475 RepID=UPI0025454CA6|nr:uncharacterized protein N7495_000748 [Penicillium taxi]KAJ5908066.1 hypothetical protein N7495_000748 [Penicillium taxi]
MWLKSVVLSTVLVAVKGSTVFENGPRIAGYFSMKEPTLYSYLRKANTSPQDGGSLSTYCSQNTTDIIPLAFIQSLSSEPVAAWGGDFTAEEVKGCQDQGKTIMVSLGGSLYMEGGWSTVAEAQASAQKLYAAYGPSGKTLATNGFDFDFEVPMSNLVAFTKEIIDLRKKDGKDGQFFLTAAPGCWYPDPNMGSVLTPHLDWFDAIFVQFYGAPGCGIPAGYQKRSTKLNSRSKIMKRSFNLETWLLLASESITTQQIDDSNQVTPAGLALSGQGNGTTKIFVGVPGSQAGTVSPNQGYVDAPTLLTALSPYLKNKNFGGVSIWTIQLAVENSGFLGLLRKGLAR